MRILHAPYNIAGQASIIARAQRALGVQSDVLVFDRNVFKYDCDICLDMKQKGLMGKALGLLSNFARCVRKYDVFHFHFGQSLLPFRRKTDLPIIHHNIDLPILGLLGKKTVMHYWGSDIRQLDVALDYLPYSQEELREIYPDTNDEKTRARVSRVNRLVDLSIVGDYSLLPYSPDSIVVNQAIDLQRFEYVGCKPHGGKVTIVHAPTNRVTKGTRNVLDALDELRRRGLAFEYVQVEGMTNKEALEVYKRADIVVDSVMEESYGILAIECMTLGKPVVCRIDRRFVGEYPGVPIVNTEPEALADNLEPLIEDPRLRVRLGEAGRRYAEKVHDSAKIAGRLIELYRRL